MRNEQGTMNHKARRVMHDTKKIHLVKGVIIALDDLDFSWNKEEIAVFMGRWRTGSSMETIAGLLRPDLDPKDALHETWVLALHLYRQGFIGPLQLVVL